MEQSASLNNGNDGVTYYNSDSAGTQTQDLRNRNPTLYSTKLRSHLLRKGTCFCWHYKIIDLFFKLFFAFYVILKNNSYLCKCCFKTNY